MSMKRLLALLLAIAAVLTVTISTAADEVQVNKPDPYQPTPTHAPTQSATQKPAQPVSVNYVRGDSDEDGTITVVDVTRIQRYLAEMPISSLGEMQSDVDGDEMITIMDATAIQRYLADIGNPYHIGDRILSNTLYLLRDTYATYVGGSVGILPVMTPADYDALSYTSGDSRVARVYSDGRVVGVKAGETTITIRTTDGSNLSVQAKVKVLSSASAAEEVDDFYEAMTPATSAAVKSYINSDSELRVWYASYPDYFNYDVTSALKADYLKRDEGVWDYIDSGLSAKKYPFSDYSSEDALASMSSTMSMNNSELLKNNNAAEQYVKNCFAKIDAVTSIDGLLRLCAQIETAGNTSILDTEVAEVELDTDGYGYMKAIFEIDTVLDSFDNKIANRAATTMIQSLLTQAGMSSTDAKTDASRVFTLAQNIYQETYAQSLKITADAEKLDDDQAAELLKEISGKMYPVSELQTLLPHINPSAYFGYMGLNGTDTAYLSTPIQTKVLDQYFTAGNLPSLKAYLKYSVSLENLVYTNTGLNTINTFYRTVYGDSVNYEDYLMSITDIKLQWDITKIQSDLYCPQATKAAVRTMCENIREGYRAKITNCSWLSDETKTALLNKLNEMGLNVLYPDDFSAYTLQADLSTKSQGGTFYSNIQTINRSKWQRRALLDGAISAKDNWDGLDTRDINSCYIPKTNACYIYEGFVNGLTFSTSRADIWNLSRLGTIVAHEIGHAFDPDSILYDADGHEATLLTEEEQTVYQKKQKQLIRAYDTFFVGVHNSYACYENGEMTLSENFSDLSSLEVILTMAGSSRYRNVYEGYASIWIDLDGFNYSSYLDDVHATDMARVNALLPLTDPFYEVYDVRPGDAMYVQQDLRVRIWD